MGKGSDISDAGHKRRKGAAQPRTNQRMQAAETELAERESALTHLLDALPLFILHVDRAERVVYINPRFAAITGYQVGEVLPFHADEPHPTWRHIDTLQPLLWSDLPNRAGVAHRPTRG